MSRYISETSLLENVQNIILFKDLQKFFDHRIRILNEKGLKANKKVKGLILKRGDFVTNRSETDKNIGNVDKIYFCVLRVLSPRCFNCENSQDQCPKCVLMPTTNVALINLLTGHKTKRSVNNIKHVWLQEILDPQFYLKLNEISSQTPDYIAQNIGLKDKIIEDSQEYYNLRSREKTGSIIEGNFGLVKKNNKYFYKDNLCQIEKPIKNSQIKKNARPILKRNPKVLTNSQLWSNWSNILSSDQLLPIIQALKLNIELQEDYKIIYETNQDIDNNPYIRSLLRNFFASYKRGDINIALTNKLHISELIPPKQKSKDKILKYNEKLSISLIELKTNYYDSSVFNDIKCVEQLIFLTCTSHTESKLFRNYGKLKNMSEDTS